MTDHATPSTTPEHARGGEKTRLAPSPTGALHPGNARTFLINWSLAQRHNWHTILRIEDLDTPRIKPGAIEETIDLIRWLGMTWRGEPIIQSADLTPYRDAMTQLANRGLAYPCELTRAQIEAASSAPNEGTTESRVTPDMRPSTIASRPFDNEHTNWRIVVPDKPITFTDHFAGKVTLNPAETVGDFVIWTKRAQPAYQLAVVVDDARQAVNRVVRGNDLLDSAARQILLYRALNLAHAIPEYWHLPLVRGPDGKRLAKRHGDTRLTTYRDAGIAPQRIIGLIAAKTGLLSQLEPMPAAAFAERLDTNTIPKTDVIFTPEDDAWLRDS